MIVNVSTFYDTTAKLADLDNYVETAKKIIGNNPVVTLTGQGPIWLYVKLALEFADRTIYYKSPVTGDVTMQIRHKEANNG
jgi:hypothetical protein